MMGWLLGAGSALVALGQAYSLVRSARGSVSPLAPLAPLARIAGVGGVLWAAARSGHWAMGAAGWGVGFVLACAFWQRRLQSRGFG